MAELQVDSSTREEMIDITALVRQSVAGSGVAEGICLVYSPHTTCGVTINEGYDPHLRHDVLQHLRELVPRQATFRHAEGNSDSHLKAMLVGSDVSIPVSAGDIQLGRWQAVFLCEFDGPRPRTVVVTVR